MPTLKARIFTNHPGNAESLAEALKQQGYFVEILRPDQTPVLSADLEIVLETCARADAVRRAAELAHDFDADVAVAQGTLTSAPAADELQAVVEPQPNPIPAAPASAIETRLQSELHQAPETWAPLELHVPETIAQEPELTQRENPAPGALARAVPRIAVTLAAWAASAREALVTARSQVHDYREHALTRIALLQAKRDGRLLELTQRRIEAQEHASRLATARKNAAAYLVQLQRESGGVIRPTNRGLAEQPAAEPAVRPWRVLFESLLERVQPVRWDAALAGLASAGALFAIGLAVASFSSKPTLTLGNEPPAANASGPVAATNAQAAPAVSNAPVAPTKPSAAHAGSLKPSPSQRPRNTHNRADTNRERDTGNDVVIHHLVTPSPTPKVQAQGWKHFSDMNNH